MKSCSRSCGQSDSPKPDVQGCYARSLERWGLDRVNLIDNADLNDEDANHNRVAVLDECRGFRRRIALFQGFPTDTKLTSTMALR